MSENTATTRDYILQFDFAYLETYSFCRGAGYGDESSSTYGQFIISDNGTLHTSAVLTHTFAKNSPQAEQLMQILSADTHPFIVSGCIPLYRDAIIFYNNDGTIVSSLNICLSCCYMQDGTKNYVEADFPTYDQLKRFFLEIGHAIEDPELFFDGPASIDFV